MNAPWPTGSACREPIGHTDAPGRSADGCPTIEAMGGLIGPPTVKASLAATVRRSDSPLADDPPHGYVRGFTDGRIGG